MKAKIKFVCCCGITGLLLCLFQKNMFTSDGLVETFLVISAMLFLMAKYSASSLIANKETALLPYGSWQQIRDNTWLYLSFEIIQPLCLCFLYAGSFLLAVKIGLLLGLDPFSQPIYDLNELNERYLDNVIWGLVSLLVLLTLLEIVSVNFSVKVKKLISGFSYVFKVIAILVCFLHLDTHIVNKNLAFRIDNEPVKTEKKVSFRYSPEQEKKIRSIIENYVAVLLHRALINDRESRVPTSTGEKTHFQEETTEMYESINNIEMENGQVDIANLFDNKLDQSRNEYSIQLLTAYNGQKQSPGNPGDENPYYNTAYAVTPPNLDNILKLLLDERKSFAEEGESLSAQLYRDEVESMVAKTFEVTGIKDLLPFRGFFGDMVNDQLHVLVTKGLYYLFKLTGASRNQVSEAINYGINEQEVPPAEQVRAIAAFTGTINEHHDRLIELCSRYKTEHDAVINVGDEPALATYLHDFPNGGDRKVTEKFNAWIKVKNGNDISSELKTLLMQIRELNEQTGGPGAADAEGMEILAKQFNLYSIAKKAFEMHSAGKDFKIPDYASMKQEGRAREPGGKPISPDPIKEPERRVRFEPRPL